MVKKVNLILGLIIAIIAFIALFYFGSIYKAPAEQNATIGTVEINETSTSEIKLIGAYWGTSTKPANSTETCSNETKDLAEGFTFSVEASTTINASSYDKCYIVNNGHEIETDVIEMHGNYANLQSKAETDRMNYVGMCCELGDRLDCSNPTTLLQCQTE